MFQAEKPPFHYEKLKNCCEVPTGENSPSGGPVSKWLKVDLLQEVKQIALRSALQQKMA